MNISNKPIEAVSAARGAVLTIGMRWTDRLIGFVSTLILARLLLPDDFGIVAMASIIVSLIDTLLDLGVGSALVQDKAAGRDEFDTAWTLRLIQAALAAGLIWMAAPFAADYFRDPRVVDVIRVMAWSVLIGGFENIGIVAFQKNMEFGRDFRFFFFRRLLGFLVTMTLAFWWRSYWAMVIGALAARCFGTLLSYRLHDYRPRLSLARSGKIWSFSQWMLLCNLGNFGQQQTDKFLVGRRGDASTLGMYTLANEIAAMPTTELLAPLGRVLFPLFVDAAHDPARLKATFRKALGIQSLVALPAGVGLYFVAGDAVRLLLGEQWLSAIPLMRILSLISVFTALTHSSSYLLLALGKVSAQAILAWIQFAMLSILGIFFFPEADAGGIALIRLACTMFGLFFLIALVLRHVPRLGIGDFIASAWRPAGATGLMALALALLPAFESLPLIFKLLASIATGALTYALGILLLWRLSGCEKGAESYLLERFRR
ncbi:MAG: lipopolysaccharide biosynthesis protein [Candidatus Accumulibacter sp.]|jgi:O-antigen/teichoic acid export membrane protein|nr:lipopolysaccharide biosynthesis protein [Accumulibacter sp.]